MNKVFIVIFFQFCFLTTFCQKAEVVLTKKQGHIPYFTTTTLPIDEFSNSLKIPKGIKLEYSNSYYTNLAPVEEAFRRYKNKEISYEVFLLKLKSVNRYAIADTFKLLRNIKKYSSSKIHFISGIDTAGDKIILVDANQDGTISPEEVFVFPTNIIKEIKENLNKREDLKDIQLVQHLSDGNTRSSIVKINPISFATRNLDSNNRKMTDFSLFRNEFWQGNLIIPNQAITVFCQSKTFYNELNELQFIIKDGDKFDKKPFDIKDVWSNDNLSLTIDSTKKMKNDDIKLFISYQSPPIRNRDTTFSMYLKNVENGNSETLRPFLNSSKYVLIDYWGTWCLPCIEHLPVLKEIKSKFLKNLSIISVAYDDDIERVKEFDKKNSVLWSSYYIDRNVARNLTKPLRITQFPTYRLYDQTGKLIYAGEQTPDKNLEAIVQILKSNL